MIINHNMGALNANRNININSAKQANQWRNFLQVRESTEPETMQQDFAISEKMRGQIRGLDQASCKCPGWYFI